MAPARNPLNELARLFYLIEQRGQVPLTRIRIDLSGAPVELGRLRRAYAQTVMRYPILNAVVRECSSWLTWNAFWVGREKSDPAWAVQQFDVSHLTPQEAEQEIARLRFDTPAGYSSTCDPPFFLRLCIRSRSAATLLAFFHHALTDGYGYSFFLEQLFSAYNAPEGACPGPRVAGTTPSLPGREPARGLLREVAIVAGRTLRRRGAVPAKMICGQPAATPAGAVERVLAPRDLQRCLDAARARSVTLTDLFTAAHVMALQRWKRGRGEPCRYIVPQIHQSLRTARTAAGDISNRFSVIAITLHERECCSSSSLPELVHQRCRAARQARRAEHVLALLQPLALTAVKKTIRWWGGFVLGNPRAGDSFQLSNMGRLWVDGTGSTRVTRLGAAEVTSVYLAAGPPIASMGTYTGLCTYRDRLFVTLNYCTNMVSAPEAERFLDGAIGALGEFCAGTFSAATPPD